MLHAFQEWACDFSSDKFKTTLAAVGRSAVPTSFCLVFWYGTVESISDALQSGIPETAGGGFVFTFVAPPDLSLYPETRTFFPVQDAVLACSVPRSLLGRVGDSSLHRILSTRVLDALRPSNFEVLANPVPWHEGRALLPPRQIVRAYQLVKSGRTSTSASEGKTVASFLPARHKRRGHSGGESKSGAVLDSAPSPSSLEKFGAAGVPWAPETCSDYLAALRILRAICANNAWALCYHFTQPSLAPIIAKTGLRMSTQGQGDGGVYFSMKGPAAYDMGSPDYETNIIEDCFGAGRLEEYRSKHKLDVCIIYGTEPWALSPAPGGRDNARMMSKATFDSLSLPTPDGNFFLRPDRILAMILLDPASPPADYFMAMDGLDEECARDQATTDALRGVSQRMDSNEAEVRAALRKIGASGSNGNEVDIELSETSMEQGGGPKIQLSGTKLSESVDPEFADTTIEIEVDEGPRDSLKAFPNGSLSLHRYVEMAEHAKGRSVMGSAL